MPLQQHTAIIEVATRGRGLVEVTQALRRWLDPLGLRQGLLTLFIRHTSASLLVQENAEPTVRDDLERFFGRLVPDGDPLFEHVDEGPDDMPAHVRAALTQVQLAIPIVDGQLALGTWQGVYVWEHRQQGHARQIAMHALGH